MADIRTFTTAQASDLLLAEIRRLLDDAFEGNFSDADWDHTLGGTHVVVSLAGTIVAHAAVVTRVLEVGDRPFRTGYLEGVATSPKARGAGLGSQAVARATEEVRRGFEMGALSTDRHGFYEPIGWERWQGPSFVRHGTDRVRTEDEDEDLMVLRFGPSKGVDLKAAITCEARRGDDW